MRIAIVLLSCLLAFSVASADGWEVVETADRPFASTFNLLTAGLLAKGYRTIRTENLGLPAWPRKLRKFSDGRGTSIYLLIWKSGVGKTSYALKRETK